MEEITNIKIKYYIYGVLTGVLLMGAGMFFNLDDAIGCMNVHNGECSDQVPVF
jgi:hypothetical protein